MEDKGLIYRKADKLDKRSVRIYLTREGKRHRDKSKETVLRFNEVVREEIPASKLNVFFEVVHEINQLIEENKIYDKVLQ
jgi:DNA-binding MarR family transcriptional regulator